MYIYAITHQWVSSDGEINTLRFNNVFTTVKAAKSYSHSMFVGVRIKWEDRNNAEMDTLMSIGILGDDKPLVKLYINQLTLEGV